MLLESTGDMKMPNDLSWMSLLSSQYAYFIITSIVILIVTVRWYFKSKVKIGDKKTIFLKKYDLLKISEKLKDHALGELLSYNENEIDEICLDLDIEFPWSRRLKKGIKEMQETENSDSTVNKNDNTKNHKYPERQNWKGFKNIQDIITNDSDLELKKDITILVVGQSGVGKSTWLNSMVNYLYETDYYDNFRFKLINEKETVESRTKEVASYILTPTNPDCDDIRVTLIDSPGFGDTTGLKADERTFMKIENLFRKEIDSISAICIVVKASDTKLGLLQKYIYNKVFSIFGNDIKDNLFVLFTFADNEEPPAFDVLKKINLNFKESFKFNNSGFKLFDHTKKDVFNESYWKMGMASFKVFFDYLQKPDFKDVSLNMTRNMLEKREELISHINFVHGQVQELVDNINQAKDLSHRVKMLGKKINTMKPNLKIKTYEWVKWHDTSSIKPGKYITTCMICNETCHEKCSIADDGKKRECWAIDSDGHCKRCTSKCFWTDHKNQGYIVRKRKVIKYIKNKDLIDEYDNDDKNKTLSQKVLSGLASKIKQKREDLKKRFDQIHFLNLLLQKMSFRYNPKTELEYVESMIKQEEETRDEDYKQRIEEYQNIANLLKFQTGDKDNDLESTISELKFTFDQDDELESNYDTHQRTNNDNLPVVLYNNVIINKNNDKLPVEIVEEIINKKILGYQFTVTKPLKTNKSQKN